MRMRKFLVLLIVVAILFTVLPVGAQEGVVELPAGFWPDGYDKIAQAGDLSIQSGEEITSAEVVLGPQIKVAFVWNNQGEENINPIFVVSDVNGIETGRYTATIPDTGSAIVSLPYHEGDYDLWISFGEPYGATSIVRIQNVIHVLNAFCPSSSLTLEMEWEPNPVGPDEITMQIVYFKWDNILKMFIEVGQPTIAEILTSRGRELISNVSAPSEATHIQLFIDGEEYFVPPQQLRTVGVELLFANDGELQAAADEGICVPSQGGNINLRVEFPWGQNTWLSFTKPGMPVPQTVEVIGPIAGPIDHWLGEIFTKPGTIVVSVSRESEILGEASLEIPACQELVFLPLVFKNHR